MLAWDDIDTVLLDMDGTLLDLHFDNHFWLQRVPERYAALQGLSLAQARARLDADYADVAGTLNWYCLDYWQARLGLDIRALKQELSHKIRWRADSRAFLSALRHSGRRLYLFTNAHPDSLALKLRHTPLHHYLDGLISSHELGHPKEAQACWQALQQRLGFAPERTLFVDDSPRVLEAAARFGIRHRLGISHPDSQGPGQHLCGLPSVNHFAALGPPLLATPRSQGLEAPLKSEPDLALAVPGAQLPQQLRHLG